MSLKALRLPLAFLAACAAWASHAQQSLEIIPLKHATVEQVLPTLRPLVEPGGVLTGERGQLIVRASPANIADIRLALEVLDRPARRLQISVRFDEGLDASRRALEASGRLSNRGSEVEVRAQDSRSASSERVDQRVQTVEGGRAFIALSESRPIAQRRRIHTPGGIVSQETLVMEDAQTGFEVVPRVSGQRVFLDIVSRKQAFTGSGVQGQGVTSSASGILGEWFELGGVSSSGVRDDRGIASASGSRASESRRIWVKVEEIPN